MLARVMRRQLPTVEMVDMREEFRETGHEDIVSRRLVAETRPRSTPRADDDSAQSARLLFLRALPKLRREDRCENCAIP